MEEDCTQLPVLNLPLCHWSSKFFDLHTPTSTDVPVLLLNQPAALYYQRKVWEMDSVNNLTPKNTQTLHVHM